MPPPALCPQPSWGGGTHSLQVGPWVLGRHRQAPVLGSQPWPSAPPTSHRQPTAGGHEVNATQSTPTLALLPSPPVPWLRTLLDSQTGSWGSVHPDRTIGDEKLTFLHYERYLGLWTMEALGPGSGAKALGLIGESCQGCRMERRTVGRTRAPLSHTQPRSGQASRSSSVSPMSTWALPCPGPAWGLCLICPSLGLSLPQNMA